MTVHLHGWRFERLSQSLSPNGASSKPAAQAEALAKLKQEPDIDVVLIDYHMQDVNGLALAAQLRKSRPDDLKVALVTANHQEKVKEKSEELGVTFIGKPATPESLSAFFGS